MEQWERQNGVVFLEKIGIEEGFRVLDFGARVGHYTIPAAILVGESGAVYAVDKEKSALEELRQKSKQLGLNNIKIIHTDGSLNVDIESGFFDVVLIYDIIHYFGDKNERETLYKELLRLTNDNGFMSIYPKHVQWGDFRTDFSEKDVDRLIKEIETTGFRFKERHCGQISHNNFINEGCMYNFVKKA